MLFTQTTEKMNNFPYSAVKPLFFTPLSLIFYGNLLHIQKLFVTLPQRIKCKDYGRKNLSCGNTDL